MDDQHDNTNPEDHTNMNGRHDSLPDAEQTLVFSRLFALDQQPDPSLRFVAQLGQSLMPSAGKMTLLSTTTRVQKSIPASLPQTQASGDGKRRRPIMSFGSAAVLMVIVVLVGYAVTLWAVNSPNDDSLNMAMASTFEASETATIPGCYVEPRNLQYITHVVEYVLYGAPDEEVSDRNEDLDPPATVPNSTMGGMPDAGAPADSETLDRLNEVFSQYVTCFNGHDVLRMYALFTDDGLARVFVPNGRLEPFLLAQLSAPMDPDYGRWEFSGFERAEVLSDGRAVAFMPVDPGYGNLSTAEALNVLNYVFFKEVDGHWLIDEMHLGRG